MLLFSKVQEFIPQGWHGKKGEEQGEVLGAACARASLALHSRKSQPSDVRKTKPRAQTFCFLKVDLFEKYS